VAGPVTPTVPVDPWFVVMRYREGWPSFSTLSVFVDAGKSVLHRVESGDTAGARWVRTSVGPFNNGVFANEYFQSNFGHFKLLPKITRAPDGIAALMK